jgi:hypothetical protein
VLSFLMALTTFIGRREFIAVLGGVGAWPLSVRAQQPKIPKVGFLYPGPSTAAAARIDAFLGGLRTAGYRVPEQVEFIPRFANGDPTQLAPMAIELIDRNADVIAAVSTGAANVFYQHAPPWSPPTRTAMSRPTLANTPCCRADARFSAAVCAYAIWHSQKRCGPIPRDFSVRQPLKTPPILVSHQLGEPIGDLATLATPPPPPPGHVWGPPPIFLWGG